MSGVILDKHPEAPKQLQNLARHQMIYKILLDIRFDLSVCDIEGFSKTEYIDMLFDELQKLRRSYCGESGMK